MKLGKDGRVDDRFMPKVIIAEMLDKGPNEVFIIDTVYKAAKLSIQLFGASALAPTEAGFCNACMTLHKDVGLEENLTPPNSEQHIKTREANLVAGIWRRVSLVLRCNKR